MIKPNELFIGAVVNYEIGKLIEHYIIDAADLMWIQDDQESFNLKHTPIPLTTEILTDWCGWEKLPYETIQNSRFIKLSGQRCLSVANAGTPNEMVFLHDLPNNLVVENIMVLRNYDREGKTYLHQLQSLYQLLTGEEMPIKLPKE